MKVIHLLRKPLSEGTVASNVLKHGCGGLNIDASRIKTPDSTIRSQNAQGSGGSMGGGMWKGGVTGSENGRFPANLILQHLDGCRCDGVKRVGGTGTAYEPAPKAREHMIYGDGRTLGRTLGYADEDGKETVANWICEDGCPVARLDEQSGMSKSTSQPRMNSAAAHNRTGSMGKSVKDWVGRGHDDAGGASRFYKQVGGEK